MYTIRIMSKEDLKWAIAQAKEEHWNPGLYDWASYYATEPSGRFIMVESSSDKQEEKKIGCISAVRYGRFAFIGLYIVIPEYRRQGHGQQLWQHAMQHINDITSQGLYAVPRQIARYEAQGFQGETINRSYTRKAPVINANPAKEIVSFNSTDPVFRQVNEFDNALFPGPRTEVLRAMLVQQQTYGIAYLAQGKVQGYCIVRPLCQGFRIGPLYANDFDVAKNIMQEAMRMVGEGQDVTLNSLLTNPIMDQFIEYFDLNRVDHSDLTAMYKGEEPQLLKENRERRFAELSLEIG